MGKKSERGELSTAKSSSKVSSTQLQIDHILASVYFLDWAKNVLEVYGKKINKLFLEPITEHCVRKKVINSATSTEEHKESSMGRVLEAGRKLEEGVKIDETNDEIKQLQRRLQLAKQENDASNYVPVYKEKWISLSEISAMYRLRTLVQMSGSLLIFVEKIRAWIEKHRKVFSQYGRECKDVLDYSVKCFESICEIASTFHFESVDRSKVRADCSKYISTKNPPKSDQKLEQPLYFDEDDEKLRSEVKILEGQINAYRASVQHVGNSLTDIVQVILKALPRGILEVTIKDVRTIMERLPPAYHFPDKYPLTKAEKHSAKSVNV